MFVQVCEIDAPWLGYGPSGSSCPPTSTPALPLQQSSALSVVLPAPVILKVAVGPASVGAKHGLASNAVYLSHPLGRGASLPASVENLRIHVRATTGASFRVSARLDALPVPSAHAAAASQTWMGAGEERVMSVAVLLSSRMPPHHLYVALEQPASSGAKEEATAEVWLESFSETLTPGGPTVAGAICCGGSAVYEVKTDEGGGNYVVIYMEAKGPGSRGVLLHVSSDAIPTRGSYVYAGQEGNARQQVSVHLGEKGDEAQMLERWYVAVLATEESNAAALSSWEETETTFTLRAEKETVTEELILDPTFAYVSLPIWAWVLISVGVGLLMGFVLLVAAYVNKVIYKSIRRKLYKLGDGQTPMASPRSQGGDACLMMQSGEGWLYSASHDEALSTKGDDLNKEPVSKIRLGSPFARLLAGINSRTPKWYDPKTFRAADSERNAEVLEGQPESHTFRAEALLLEPYLIPSPKAVLERKVEMIDIPEGEALQTAEVAPTSLIENINNQLWRTSVVASSVTAFEGDAETPTSAGGTPANSIGGFSVLNERMAVLAQAEELEERRKPRPDSSNPVRFPSQTSRAPGTDDIDSHVTVITLRDKFAQACDKYAPGPSPRPKVPWLRSSCP